MDRFIDEHGQLKKSRVEHLKSNMDRFIDTQPAPPHTSM